MVVGWLAGWLAGWLVMVGWWVVVVVVGVVVVVVVVVVGGGGGACGGVGWGLLVWVRVGGAFVCVCASLCVYVCERV